MKSAVAFFLLITCPFVSTGVNDSLRQLLNSKTEKDTARVHALIDMAAHHYHDNLDSSLLLIEQAFELSNALGFKRGEGFSNTAKSGYFFQKGSLDSALIYANKGADILESIGDKTHILAAYNNMAMIYNGMDKPQKAIEIYLKIFHTIENTPPSIQHMAICNNLAIAIGKRDLMASEKWFQKVLSYAEALNHPTGLAYGYNGVAGVYLMLNQYQESIDYSLKGLAISRKYQMDKVVIEALQNLGMAYHKCGQLNKANSTFLEALALTQNIGSKRNLKVIYEGLSEVAEQKGNYKEALAYNRRYHQIKDTIFSEEKIKIIEELETKYETAELKRMQTLTALDNEQLSQENELKAVKNKQLIQKGELSEIKASKNRYYFIGVLVTAILMTLSGIFYFIQFRNKKRTELIQLELKETNKRLLIENKYRESELKAIKAQMNPHFMFNALNSIQEYIMLNKKDLASDYLGKFADLMRVYLNQSNQSLIDLNTEIKSINLYVELEALRQEDLQFSIVCEDDFLVETKLPPMLIQPYVENAIKHGLWHKKMDKKLKIMFSRGTNNLKCIITDNGVGIAASKIINAGKQRHTSFSKEATESRLTMIRERYGNAIDIVTCDLRNEKNEVVGTKVQISIPLNLKMT